ncbi:MAG: patatin-like phospholipase family protein [bacterium]|nr:patatin-like phospholipase family protein [bacterium]
MRYFARNSLVFVLLIFAAAISHAKTTALALSGGGARGFAHIGIIQALEEEGLEPDLIVGTSMGAVVGGLWAAGYSAAEMKSIALATDWSGLFLDRPQRRNLFLAKKETRSRHILALRFRGWEPELPVALSSGQQVSELFCRLVNRAPYHAWPSFDDLRIPFRAVATDLVTGKSVVFSEGDLAEVMRAAVSLPLILVPYEMDTLLLVDGGVIENIPVEAARREGAEIVVAVDMSSGFEPGGSTDLPWDLADRVTTLMHIERNNASRRLADLVIAPDVGPHKASDFGDADSLISAGYRAAQENMPRLRALLRPAQPDSSCCATFCSRERLRALFRTTAPNQLPPRAHRFAGMTTPPDSSLLGRGGSSRFSELETVRRGYAYRGRSLAHVTELGMDSTGTLVSRWEEGRIRSIRVTGLRRYRPWTVLRDFPLAEGQLFDLRLARRGVTQIYGSDLFSSVTLSALPTDSGAHLTLRVRERESPQLRMGAGYSLERKGRGFLEFLNDNALNLGARLTLFGKYGERDEAVSARLTFDRLPSLATLGHGLQTHTVTDFRAGWTREEYNFFDAQHRDTSFYFFERSHAAMWVGGGFPRWGEVAAGLRYESVRAGGVLDEPTAHVTYVGVRTVIDTKDDYPFPTSGFAWNGGYEYALKSRQTGRAFNRMTAAADGFLPLSRRWVLHGAGDWAWNDRMLPLWGRFPLGGETSLLGLHVAEYYGSSRVTALAEIRHDLLSRWIAEAYLSAIYTVGAVSMKSDPLPKSSDYLHGIGGRFALSTLLGPLTFTVGELLPSCYGPDQTMFYVNLGHEF